MIAIEVLTVVSILLQPSSSHNPFATAVRVIPESDSYCFGFQSIELEIQNTFEDAVFARFELRDLSTGQKRYLCADGWIRDNCGHSGADLLTSGATLFCPKNAKKFSWPETGFKANLPTGSYVLAVNLSSFENEMRILETQAALADQRGIAHLADSIRSFMTTLLGMRDSTCDSDTLKALPSSFSETPAAFQVVQLPFAVTKCE